MVGVPDALNGRRVASVDSESAFTVNRRTAGLWPAGTAHAVEYVALDTGDGDDAHCDGTATARTGLLSAQVSATASPNVTVALAATPTTSSTLSLSTRTTATPRPDCSPSTPSRDTATRSPSVATAPENREPANTLFSVWGPHQFSCESDGCKAATTEGSAAAAVAGASMRMMFRLSWVTTLSTLSAATRTDVSKVTGAGLSTPAFVARLSALIQCWRADGSNTSKMDMPSRAATTT